MVGLTHSFISKGVFRYKKSNIRYFDRLLDRLLADIILMRLLFTMKLIIILIRDVIYVLTDGYIG